MMIDATAILISPKSTTISLGRSRRSAARFSDAATTPPPSSRNAPVTCRNSSHSYVVKARRLRRRAATYNRRVDETARHLRLLTETIAVVNSTLDLEEVLSLV